MLEIAWFTLGMARPLTRAQALENAAFLRILEGTGNVRLAARETGKAYATMQHRRKQHPPFAQEWDAALVAARARLAKNGGEQRPQATATAHRTQGGETVVVGRRDGRFQVRRAQPGKLTRACEQAFLAALSATANIALSASAAGAAEGAFYRRRRNNPAFAREWRLALQQGYEAVEMALLASWRKDSSRDDAWRHNEPPPVPPMTANQALQLLYLHQKAALNLDEPPYMKRRRGESGEAWSFRLSAMYRARQERDREVFRVAEAARLARGEGPYWGEDKPVLPDLAQVTGWSRADPAKEAQDETRALFGGWRIKS